MRLISWLQKMQEIRTAVQQFGLSSRFFIVIASFVLFAIVSFAFPWMLQLVWVALIVLLALVLVDIVLLYSNGGSIQVERKTTRMLSLGDENEIVLHFRNKGAVMLRLEIYDEVPIQFQKRDFVVKLKLASQQDTTVRYKLRPTSRGVHAFGFVNVISRSMIGLGTRRNICAAAADVPVYPSIIQMKKFELMAFARLNTFEGLRKIRRIGHSYEFDQIKTYVQGDDIRSVNWKATGRRNQLMVNTYEDERSQQVYTIIDKSRNMHMPFNGLSLLDYSINTSLVISNIVLRKHDKAGLITFSHKLGSAVPADRGEEHLKRILESLYKEKPQTYEANYDLLAKGIRNVIKSRSLIFLYTNFESIYGLDRALPVLRRINHQHLLVVMIFENTELTAYAQRPVEFVSDIYANTIALKLLNEKKQIVSRLRKLGIQTILSKPEDLNINTVNKYLELKARGLI
jgi:uncharacterized protein (DUF58 family)